jgi:hypothetical protein
VAGHDETGVGSALHAPAGIAQDRVHTGRELADRQLPAGGGSEGRQ